MTSRRSGAAAAIALTIGMTLSACSNPPPECAHLHNLQQSVKNLRNVPISQGALSKIRKDLTKIRKQLTYFQNQAHSRYSVQSTQVRKTIDTLSADLSAAVSNPSASTLAPIPQDVQAVANATSALATQLNNIC